MSTGFIAETLRRTMTFIRKGGVILDNSIHCYDKPRVFISTNVT